MLLSTRKCFLKRKFFLKLFLVKTFKAEKVVSSENLQGKDSCVGVGYLMFLGTTSTTPENSNHRIFNLGQLHTQVYILPIIRYNVLVVYFKVILFPCLIENIVFGPTRVL